MMGRGRRYCASKMLEWGVPLRQDVVLISEPLMNLRSGLDLPGSSNAEEDGFSLEKRLYVITAASHHYLPPPTTTCRLPPLPAASHHYLLPPITPCRLPPLPTASHDSCCLPRLLIPKDGLQPTFWITLPFAGAFQRKMLGP
jgi:hypothetical protein